MLATAASGLQAVLMVPTEILAEQHYANLEGLWGELWLPGLKKLSSELRLLTGSLKPSDKARIYEEIESGKATVIIGTHALIQEELAFRNLGLVVIDEQHRFGVTQRASLRQKGHNPHVLVMTATPIPRTLALTLYGDLDISTIDELPPGRKEITTKWLQPRERERAYAFVRARVEERQQAFIICPLVEESEKIEARAAVEEHRRLQEEVFPDLRLGLLHGRMTAEEKEVVMREFHRGDLDILVCTPVVEVGIDVPNATVMLIEDADRFGLAQLHQFRGRVGRGEQQSYCLLLTESPTESGEQRLEIIASTQDGFKLADEDLAMRGPGEFFGTRQSGLPDLKVARLSDVRVLEEAREVAQEIWEEDPALELPKNRLLATRVDEFWQRGKGDLS
ncbi:MAG: ATP-dependent DNA helicase RecG, partial [Anaerolineae bacterium]|nr:ATP-dependent DNA helicase RecG [Anaerolineae bacterium]